MFSALRFFGPGILFAASAVGMSHLVHASRSGALYGLGLIIPIAIICAVKYPLLRFGTDYAAATGNNLVYEYRRQGILAFLIYAFVEITAVIFVVTALALFTSGIAQTVIPFEFNSKLGALAVIFFSALLLSSGSYSFFEKFSKILVLVFSVLVIGASLTVAPQITWTPAAFIPQPMDKNLLLFTVAVAGGMPTLATGSVWQSLWICAKNREEGEPKEISKSVLDFNISYIGTIIVAIAFIILGAAFMFNRSMAFESSGAGFALQLMNNISEAYGPGFRLAITFVAFSVIISTLLTALDGGARAIIAMWQTVLPESKRRQTGNERSLFRIALAALVIASTIPSVLLTSSFTQMVDFTTTLLFVTSPIIALLNHRAIYAGVFPAELRPAKSMRVWSIVGIWVLAAITAIFLYMRFIS